MRSYGCQLGVVTYLSEKQVLQLQLIDRDSYCRTIARCQYTFRLPKKIAFTFPYGKVANCIILVDGVTGEVHKYEDNRFDFRGTKTVVVLNELYAFR